MELKCKKCLCYLGEMTKGKLKKGSVLLCTECMGKYKVFEDLANYSKSAASGKYDVPDFLNDLFKAKK